MTSLMTTLGPEGGSKTDNQQLNTEQRLTYRNKQTQRDFLVSDNIK